jgi:tRNA pseudouridine(55) synthase
MPLIQVVSKEYEALVRLGIRTDTMDPTGEVTSERSTEGIEDEAIRAVVAGFLGPQEQQIPRYSAARVDGKHLYEYARKGEEVELPVKQITIERIDVEGIDRTDTGIDVKVRVLCSAGTYVRALADDIGELLGCGGHLAELRRRRTGGHCLDDGIALQTILDQAEAWRDERSAAKERGESQSFDPVEHARRWQSFLGDALVPVHRSLGDLPQLRLPQELVERVEQGQPLRKGEITAHTVELVPFQVGDRLVAAHPDGLRAVALLRAAVSRDSLPRRGVDEVVLEIERVLR